MSLLDWPLFVAIFMGHENGDNKGTAGDDHWRRHVQCMLDETDPLSKDKKQEELFFKVFSLISATFHPTYGLMTLHNNI